MFAKFATSNFRILNFAESLLDVAEILPIFYQNSPIIYRFFSEIRITENEYEFVFSEIYRNKNYVRVPHLVGYGDDSG